MKNIIIKNLKMVNFQGFKEITIEFNPVVNAIRGMNATGKSTIMRAFSYLLFGNDQYGRTDFEIKPLTETGEPIHSIDSEVSAELIVENEKIVLKKIYHEKWVKPRGKAEAIFTGHETLYYFNGVPVTMREYNAKIDDICPEDLFKLLTNPLYFPLMPWLDQRKLLFDIAGTIPDEEIASKKKTWVELLKTINNRKTMDEYKREIASEKRKIRDDLDRIPARIDEEQRNVPAQEEDWKAIEKAINEKGEEIRSIDNEISDLSASMEKKFQQYRSKKEEVNKKKSALQIIEFDIQKNAKQKYFDLINIESEKKDRIKNFQIEIEKIERSDKNLEQEKQACIIDRDELRTLWHEINKAKEIFFLEAEFICPTCKRPFDDSDIEAKKTELTARYNEERAKKLAMNVASGKEVSAKIDMLSEAISENKINFDKIQESIKILTAEIESGDAEISKANIELKNWQLLLKSDTGYQRILNEIKEAEESLGIEPGKVDISDQTNRKEAIQAELKDLIQRLNNREFIDRAKRRIEDLTAGQKDLAQKLADLEKIEYNIQEFTRAKIDTIEEKINSRFSKVKFKLFNKLVNGEEEETCQITIDGVPWGDLNNAAKYQSGLDVINTLTDYYKVNGPIWIDNREAITDIPKINGQVINLYVDPAYKTLTIN